jgi:hypothetical protein
VGANTVQTRIRARAIKTIVTGGRRIGHMVTEIGITAVIGTRIIIITMTIL